MALPFQYRSPRGWMLQPAVDRNQALDWRAPPGTEPAAILLLAPVPAAGALEDQLRALLPGYTTDAEVLEASEVHPFDHPTLPARLIAVRLRVTRASRVRDERRVVVLLGAGPLVLPVVLLGGPHALRVHEQAFAALLRSISPTAPTPFPID